MIIGLCGKKHSGKSTIAAFLQEKYNFIRGDFAAPITLMGIQLLRYQNVSEAAIAYITGSGRDTEIVPELGYRTFRWFQQTLGTDWGRDIMHENLWINAMINTDIFENKNVVVENVRFLGEANAITHRGGYIIRIVRPNGNVDSHKSETELLDIQPDFTMNNDSSTKNLLDRIELLIEEIEKS